MMRRRRTQAVRSQQYPGSFGGNVTGALLLFQLVMVNEIPLPFENELVVEPAAGMHVCAHPPTT